MFKCKYKKIIEKTTVFVFTEETILLAIKIQDKYKSQYYDSLIIATALENGCSVLYSEDM
ncbi:MAG TPA: PIN domain-containing protein [Sulfurovum sp.]|nr:PIN domain-containing protein [Sulfurovum sp.]